MRFNKFILAITGAISGIGFAQNIAQDSTNTPKIQEVKISFLDSIKKTFVYYNAAQRIDERWQSELASLDQFDEMTKDIATIDLSQKVDYELPTELLKQRLKKLDEKSPFHIEYNEGLENLIKNYLKNRRRSFERLMGLSQYYFPIFEEALAKQNLPLEIKYLAVVESALKPKAVSSAKATGLWQFMFDTGRQYGLKIDSYVDERSNELKASDAAARYMKASFDIFNDWELVLASYNSGVGNVSKAIKRSGGQQNFWNIKKHLPRETQAYVPAFLATMYIFEYHKEHGITPDKALIRHFDTDTVAVKKHLTFKQISDLLDISVEELEYFNPAFKRKEIPYVTGETPHFLRLPKSKIDAFVSNEQKIYAYADYVESQREKPIFKQERLAARQAKDSLNVADTGDKTITRYKYHKVRRGDTLTEIADKYGVSIADVKSWNRLRSNSAPLGRTLKIKFTETAAYKQNEEAIAQNNTQAVEKTPKNIAKVDKKSTQTDAIAAVEKIEKEEPKFEKITKTEKVVTNKEVVKYHKVKSGDVISQIADKNNVSVADLKKWNHLKSNNIQLGDNLKIITTEKVVTTVKKEIKVPVKETTENRIELAQNKTKKANDNDTISEKYYVVAKGDNIQTIAKKFGVTKQNLKDWNNLIDSKVKTGSQLIVSGDAVTEEENQQEKVKYVVKKGETLAAIAKKYNTTIDKIKELNNLSIDGVYADQTLVLEQPKTEVAKNSKKEKQLAEARKAKEKLYEVRRGDTLFSISKKFPGVSIADIKKWNNIKSESLTPGMKLKING